MGNVSHVSLWGEGSGRPEVLSRAIRECRSGYLACTVVHGQVRLIPEGETRILRAARDSGAGLIYSDYVLEEGELRVPHPVNDYLEGSVRDDFDFGPLVFIDCSIAQQAIDRGCFEGAERFGAFYGLRLGISEIAPILHLEEPLYRFNPGEVQATAEERQFAYVATHAREYQQEMERVFTAYSRRAGFYLPERVETVDHRSFAAPVEMSVVIPVRNRERTIRDAVASALSQKLSVPFNVIVVDNHSTDATTAHLAEIARNDPRVVHIIPEHPILGIGGCWNEAVFSSYAGRFVVQLDSDDLYHDERTLERIRDTFRTTNGAAVVGSYSLVNFALESLPPGLIDHREWSDSNGHNNALRINGFGAPRAYFTPIIRQHPFPNTSYGEDYAAMLAISRQFRIGRIYESLYLCRRWEGNTEAAASREKLNRFNHLKDSIRTIEIRARKQIVAG